jgi:FlaA1/EpsC-like NDP-sugar epimerase
VARGTIRLKRPSSYTRLLSRVGLWDLACAGASPLLAFLVRDGTLKSPQNAAIYCTIAVLVSLFVFQWLQTNAPIYRYFSIIDALNLFKACIVITAVTAVLAFLFTRLDDAARSIPVLHIAFLTSGLAAGRLLARLHAMRNELGERNLPNAVQHILLVQTSRLAWLFSKLIEELAPGEYQIVAILRSEPQPSDGQSGDQLQIRLLIIPYPRYFEITLL